jgi:four helix bundle protein
METNRFDLEDRLLSFAANVVRLAENMPETMAGRHVAGQLLRSGTSPLSNHAEAEAAESRSDFIHKLSICHKELRESARWLQLTRKARFPVEANELESLLAEASELVRIFAASIRTARANASSKMVRETDEEYEA